MDPSKLLEQSRAWRHEDEATIVRLRREVADALDREFALRERLARALGTIERLQAELDERR